MKTPDTGATEIKGRFNRQRRPGGTGGTWQTWKHIVSEYCRHNPAGENQQVLTPIAELISKRGNQEMVDTLLTWPEYVRKAEERKE